MRLIYAYDIKKRADCYPPSVRSVVANILRHTKTVKDAVVIVRCKDCKHKHLENMDWTCPFGFPGGENFFCGYGAEPYKGEQE